MLIHVPFPKDKRLSVRVANPSQNGSWLNPHGIKSRIKIQSLFWTRRADLAVFLRDKERPKAGLGSVVTAVQSRGATGLVDCLLSVERRQSRCHHGVYRCNRGAWSGHRRLKGPQSGNSLLPSLFQNVSPRCRQWCPHCCTWGCHLPLSLALSVLKNEI